MWCFCSKFQITHFGSKNWMDGWMIKGWKKILALKSVEIILHQPPNLNVLSIFVLEKGRPLFRHLQLKISSVSKLCTETFFFLDQLHLRFFFPPHRTPIRSDQKSPGDVGGFFSEKGKHGQLNGFHARLAMFFCSAVFWTRSRWWYCWCFRNPAVAPVDMVNIPSIYRVSAPCWVVFSPDFWTINSMFLSFFSGRIWWPQQEHKKRWQTCPSPQGGSVLMWVCFSGGFWGREVWANKIFQQKRIRKLKNSQVLSLKPT